MKEHENHHAEDIVTQFLSGKGDKLECKRFDEEVYLESLTWKAADEHIWEEEMYNEYLAWNS